MILKENITGQKAIYKTRFYYDIDDSILSFYFHCYHSSQCSYSNKDNDPIYLGDVCEVFICTGEENSYLEIEIAPNGTIFFAKIFRGKDKREHSFLDTSIIKKKVINKKNSYIAKFSFDIKKLQIDRKNLGINAFRIETDNEKSNKHLFAMNPTMCDSFHTNCIFKKI